MTHGGDGGASAFQSPSIFYTSYYWNNVYRTLNGGSSYTNISPQAATAASLNHPGDVLDVADDALLRH